MIKNNTHPVPEFGQVIEITNRKCSDKVQPNIKANVSYAVEGNDTLKDGTVVLLLHNPKDENRPYRINAQRFDWQIVTYEMVCERKFKEECQKNTKELVEKFTFAEHIYIAFTPLIFASLAFHYGMECRKYAANNRLSEYRKLSRAFDDVKDRYRNDLLKDIDDKHIKNIESDAQKVMQAYASDFIILRECVKRELFKKYPAEPHWNLRADAYCGMLMISVYKEHNKKVDALIASRLEGHKGTANNPLIEALYVILDAYSGDYAEFDINQYDIQTAKNIVHRKVQESEYSITEKEWKK